MLKDNTAKKIKKEIYGKPQQALLLFPPGFGSICLQEVQGILDDLFLKNEESSTTVTLHKKYIQITNISFYALVEILARAKTISDVRFILKQKRVIHKEDLFKLCLSLPWNLFLSPELKLRVKAESTSSSLYHEGAIREVVEKALTEKGYSIAKEEEESVLYFEIFKDVLTISLSLVGSQGMRGYKKILNSLATLREDIAQSALQTVFAQCSVDKKDINTLFVPFAGSGTFIFEHFLLSHNVSPILFERPFFLEKLPFFNEKHFSFVKNKAKSLFVHSLPPVPCQSIYLDNAQKEVSSFQENILFFSEKIEKIAEKKVFNIDIKNADFFTFDIDDLVEENKRIFVPLNPPYGIRLAKNTNIENLYANIGKHIEKLGKRILRKNSTLLGFILCPDEKTWKNFLQGCPALLTKTTHFTLGGKDMRLCLFSNVPCYSESTSWQQEGSSHARI